MNTSSTPQTLIEVVTFYADEDRAVAYVAEQRWPNGPECPMCGGKKVGAIKTRRTWECKDCKKQFSVKIGTVMEDSPIPVGKWMVVIWLAANAKNSISSYEVARAIGITQKSAWFMMHRVHLAMQDDDDGAKLSGTVEADETFVGGKARNMHAGKRKAKGRGAVGKAVVMGLLERSDNKAEVASKVKAFVVSNTKRKTLAPVIREHVEAGSHVYTDALKSYNGLEAEFVHKFIDHAVSYVEGAVHTNSLENFWSLFKRCIKGTHVSVEPFHLHRYVDGEAFRFNNRKAKDGGRFARVVNGITGKRLTYKQLIGEDQELPPQQP